MSDLDQFKQTYITECFELLADMEQRLLALDLESVDSEALNAIFRCAHSIKGGSGAFGLTYITDFTHALEALLDGLREGKTKLTRGVVDALLKASDIVTQMVDAANDGAEPPAGFGDEVRCLLESLADSDGHRSAAISRCDDIVGEREEKQWLIEFTPHPDLFASGNEPTLILRELSGLGNVEIQANFDRVPLIEAIDPTACWIYWTVRLGGGCSEAAIREVFEFVEDHCDLIIRAVEEDNAKVKQTENTAAKSTLAEGRAPHPASATSIRVDLEKVDRLVNMVGELVITEAMLHAQTRGLIGEQYSGLLRGIDELAQHTRELQEAVMSVRMQPVKSIFSRMPRVVRDISAQLGKNIRLEMTGESTEVDKTVIENLSDPIMHMIRNSCDHGIEMPAVRLETGKSDEGVIMLSADHRGGRIVIEISDDGAGINRERVLAKARERGVVAADAEPTAEEIDNMIFAPGFSTAEVVTNVSGRGVGMDVVKRNIEGMGGTVRVANDPGRGARFTVSLPLTLAILDGMIVRVGTENYIIPITSILETLRPVSEEVRHVEGHSDVINVRGEFISLIYLHRTFNISNAQEDPSKALVVLVECNQQKMGLVVDELIGQQQVVIKSLEANADPVKGISGATILGDGRVSLILEINDLDQSRAPSRGADFDQAA